MQNLIALRSGVSVERLIFLLIAIIEIYQHVRKRIIQIYAKQLSKTLELGKFYN